MFADLFSLAFYFLYQLGENAAHSSLTAHNFGKKSQLHLIDAVLQPPASVISFDDYTGEELEELMTIGYEVFSSNFKENSLIL